MGSAGPAWLATVGLAGRFLALDGRVETVGAWPVETERIDG